MHDIKDKLNKKPLPFLKVPMLNDLFTRCPVPDCFGTIDTDFPGIAYCCSCDQKWALDGRPIKQKRTYKEITDDLL